MGVPDATNFLPLPQAQFHVLVALTEGDHTIGRGKTCEVVSDGYLAEAQRLCRKYGSLLIADEGLRSVHFGDPDSLAAILRGELWRGRDNLRVSLRGPLSLRAAPSVLIPAVDVALLGTAAVAPAIAGGLRIAAICLVGFVALALLRAVKIVLNLERPGIVDLVRALAVAAAYDLGRALALVLPASHAVRRRRATA